jgi:hypothetical protein
LLLKSFTAVAMAILLTLSFAAAVPQRPGASVASPSSSNAQPAYNTGISLEIHVANQYGVPYNRSAVVEVFLELSTTPPLSLSLEANGTTNDGYFFAGNLTQVSTYLVQVYTSTGGQGNQTVAMTSNAAIVNIVIPSPPTPTLSLENVVVNASSATPGAPFSVTATVVNTSNSTAYNVILDVKPPAQFSLLNTGSSIVLGTFTPGGTEGVTMLLSVSGAATTAGYAIGYNLTYSDYAGVGYSIPGSISLPAPPSPNLVIENVVLNPTVIQPGSTFTLTAVVVNSGNSTAFNSVLTLAPPAEFSLLSTGSVIPLGTLATGASKSLTLQLIVSSSGAPTANLIAYSLTYTDYFLNKDTTTGNLFVPVSGNPVQPKLIITTATFSSSAIHPGDNFSVPIVIQNVANVPANEVVLSVNATSPLVTTGSAGDYRLGVISGNGNISIVLGFSSPPSAVLGSYQIVLTLAYQDSFGTLYTTKQVLVATIVGQPSLVFNILQFKNNPLTPGLQTFFNAQLLNAGGEAALNVKVMFQNAPSFLGNSTIFLGSIQPGGTGNATSFLQIPANMSVGSYQFNAVVSYTDSVGRGYQIVAPYTVTVAPFSPPMVSITNTLLSPEVLAPGSQGTMTIYFRNNGASPANNLTLSLLNGSRFFTSNYFGLGTLDPSTSGTSTVGVNVAGNLKGGQYLVQILATYTDDNGVAYNSTLPLEITVYATTSLLSFKTVGIVLAVVIIAVAVYALYTYRRRGAKPKSTAPALESKWQAPLVEKQTNASGPTRADDKTKL